MTENNPSYFQGQQASRSQLMATRQRQRAKGPAIMAQEPGTFARKLGLAAVVALLLVAAGFFGLWYLHDGNSGVWEGWHGRKWSAQEMVSFLEREGANFVLAQVRNEGFARLEFQGYQEAIDRITSEESDIHARAQRLETIDRSAHVVTIRKFAHDEAASVASPDEALGVSWIWGHFIFRGDPENVRTVRSVLTRTSWTAVGQDLQ